MLTKDFTDERKFLIFNDQEYVYNDILVKYNV